jgi:hypothetical protein
MVGDGQKWGFVLIDFWLVFSIHGSSRFVFWFHHKSSLTPAPGKEPIPALGVLQRGGCVTCRRKLRPRYI